MTSERDLERATIYQFRDSFKKGLYEAFIGRQAKLVTLTYRDDAFIHEPTAKYLLDRAKFLMDASHCTGVLLAETSKAGRLHLHGLVDTSSKRLRKRQEWFQQQWGKKYGLCTFDEITDFLGAINYLCKAVGTSTEYYWKVRGYAQPNGSARDQSRSTGDEPSGSKGLRQVRRPKELKELPSEQVPEVPPWLQTQQLQASN